MADKPSIAAVVVSGDIDDLGSPQPRKYAECAALPLRQFWNGANAFPEEAGVAFVGVSDVGLNFCVRYEDSDIFSRATADNEKMWMLGDVAEIFVKPGVKRPDYWEIHITPKAFLMDIHIPSLQKMQEGEVTWEELVAPNSGSRRKVAVHDGLWAAEIVIPWQAFDCQAQPEQSTAWQFAVCRYNYNGGLENPELSSTAHLGEPGFHRYDEYTDLVF